jgi:hypothetical protein
MSALEFARLRNAIDSYGAVIEKLIAVSGQSDKTQLLELVGNRRQLADRSIAISAAIKQAADAHPTWKDQQEFQNRFSRARTATALHQANWVRDDPEGFDRSVASVAVELRDFIGWASSRLRPL